MPTGAAAERTGYWTILTVPPAPFTARLPDPPPAPDARQKAAANLFSRYAEWQGRVQGEAATVHNFLREREKGNYVDMRFSGSEDGRFRVVYSFLRDGPGTLRKYISRPDFEAETVRWSEDERRAAMQVMMDFLQREDVRGWSGGTGTASNRAEVQLPLTRGEWDALVARRGFKVPEAALLSFAARSATEINKPLAPDIARGIRLLARSDAAPGAVPSIATTATIVLRDGCFRIGKETASGTRADAYEGAHVLFPLGQQLFRDAQGYLAFGTGPRRGYGRVGERQIFDGTLAEVREGRFTAQIHKACGPGKVVAITAPSSASAEGKQETLATNHRTYAALREMWGLSEKGARAYLTDCMDKNGGFCPLSPPPPAIGPCPAGTTKSGGLCRTPQGHIRPVPKGLEPYLAL